MAENVRQPGNARTNRVGLAMIETEGRLIGEAFSAVVARYADQPFLVVPRDAQRGYRSGGSSTSYGDALAYVEAATAALAAAGYGHGHRIAVLLENRPEILLLKLAFATLGISWVPVNPDYRPSEIAYLLQDSGAELVIALPHHVGRVDEAAAEIAQPIAIMTYDPVDAAGPPTFPEPSRAARLAQTPVTPATEASLLYTSGTTGRPKGCIISHEYELMMGAWYATRGGRLTITEMGERVYNPLPLFHVNAGIILFYCMMLTGNCQILPERFSRGRWWSEIRETEATGIHYLGVVIPVLMNEPAGPHDRDHKLRWGLGAGVEPSLHAAFEERFGFPLIEVWGMTEMCRILADCHEPRQIHTRAMGRPQPGLEVRVVDEADNEVPHGTAGEMVVRHSAETPRKGAFSGYLNHPEATEEAWRGGWFHTGDTVSQDDTGMLYFVDRKKNIIRRSGENIAAAEIEACLQAHANVAQVAVIPIADEMRDEEVMACVIIRDKTADRELAEALFAHCNAELAYYKAPGWVVFVDSLPVTGTQKVLKHMIFGEGQDPRVLPEAHDLRSLKKR
jgi:acyl-CoA synthetase (AMP-forming)/AMP-acid ligase II